MPRQPRFVPVRQRPPEMMDGATMLALSEQLIKQWKWKTEPTLEEIAIMIALGVTCPN